MGYSRTQKKAPLANDGNKRGAHIIGLTAVFLSLFVAALTFAVLAGLTPILPTHNVVLTVFFINFAVVFLLILVIAWQARKVWKARTAGLAASGLHRQVMGLFGLVAILPAVFLAVAGTVTLRRGLNPWFTGDVQNLMNMTLSMAQAYRESQCQSLARETQLMAADLTRARVLYSVDREVFREFMRSRAVFLGFPVALLLEPTDAKVIEKVEIRKPDNFSYPDANDIRDVSDKDATCLIPREGNVYSAILKIPDLEGKILYVARGVDPFATMFPAIAEAGVTEYQLIEQKNAAIQITFPIMFALIALIGLLSATWFGLNFANRLVAPIRRLIHATDQVAIGNFYVQVPVRSQDGDIAHLGETFNKMTSELRNQHDGLTEANEIIDRRRRFTEAVLAGVSAGVIGLDEKRKISLVNPSATVLLQETEEALIGRHITDVLPEITPILDETENSRQKFSSGQMTIKRNERERTLNIKITNEINNNQDNELVITIDDITDLILAQRTSAWADVARRIAHEIKNPLTPIQLSAERIHRKYGKVIITDREVFDQCTATIVRQVEDIKRMVDEFSSFARMPKPTIGEDDLVETVRQVVFMLRISNPEIQFIDELPERAVRLKFDRRLLSQAFTNIIKNATEAITAIPDEDRGQGVIRISMTNDLESGIVLITVTDNGKGFPEEGRQKLLEPYMTTREGGTGLGLAIVAKILEDHGGGLELADNPDGRGGQVRMRISRLIGTKEIHEREQTEDRVTT
ncbi:PAS domain-containing sensor histidine kinase [Microvirga sp. W0021]|uniref:histidine kinase n=1 Tax=Hohaiivirga grylli TaxID=3133970 RepID=A0ABV0BIM7_9HYPH